jgi:hypothetical protein
VGWEHGKLIQSDMDFRLVSGANQMTKTPRP